MPLDGITFEHPVNDGTNACAFLTLKIAEFLLEYEQDGKQYDNFSIIKPIIENLIFCIPMKVNSIRDVDSYYDIKAAHELMLKEKFIRKFNLTTLIESTDIYSIENQSALKSGLEKLNGVAIVASSPYVLVIGNNLGQPFIIDTHLVPTKLGGNNNGIIVMFPDTENAVLWLLTRLHDCGVLTGGLNVTQVCS